MRLIVGLAFALLVVGACRTHEKKEDMPPPPIAASPVVPELPRTAIVPPAPPVQESVSALSQGEQVQVFEDPELAALAEEVRLLNDQLAALKAKLDRIKAQITVKRDALHRGVTALRTELDAIDLGGDKEDDDGQ